MAFRLLRICSNEESFETRLSELNNNFLIPRGYTPKLIDRQFDRIRKLPGNTFEEKRFYSLEKQVRDNTHKDRIIVPIDYNPQMAKHGDELRNHYNPIIRKNENVKEFHSNPPI